MADLIENYKEVKLQLETKCASYDMEIERMTKRCNELEQENVKVHEMEKKCKDLEQVSDSIGFFGCRVFSKSKI